jgi:rSAM/selenodomain-associated transferase 2/rSAM/selenodomain-associated transferase 1
VGANSLTYAQSPREIRASLMLAAKQATHSESQIAIDPIFRSFSQRDRPLPDIAIIMPVLNEGLDIIAKLARHQDRHQNGYWLVIVDGSEIKDQLDANNKTLSQFADVYVRSPRGRAAQMNAGADALIALKIKPKILLFLHADTELPDNALNEIRQHIHSGFSWGRFDVKIIDDDKNTFANRHSTHHKAPWTFNLIGAMMNWRSRLTSIATGDQAIFVLRREFEAVGGYPVQSLMEDIALSLTLRARRRPANLRSKVRTSGRRWTTHGTVQTILTMWRLRWLYSRGVDPSVLATAYGYKTRAVADVAIMARAPLAGQAKTRLIPLLGPQGAARAHRKMLLKTIATARWASTGALTLWCASDIHGRFFSLLNQRFGLPLIAQPHGNLGVRMGAISRNHFRVDQQRPLIIVGTDCPYLTPQHFDQVAQKLQTVDVVFIGANDGGYVLIGLGKHIPEVFASIEWSTEQVLTQSIAQLKTVGASFCVLESLSDIDTPDDWQQLAPQRLKLFPEIELADFRIESSK